MDFSTQVINKRVVLTVNNRRDTLQFMPIEVPSLTDGDVIFLWIRRNKSVCARISRDLNLSRQFVSQVLYGFRKSTDLQVERALIEAGAPFVADRIAEVG